MAASISTGHQPSESLSLGKLFSNFKECLPKNEDIETDDFVVACKSVLPLLGCFGIIMKPVVSDISEKVDYLVKYRQSNNGEKYSTVKGLVQEYDKINTFENSFFGCWDEGYDVPMWLSEERHTQQINLTPSQFEVSHEIYKHNKEFGHRTGCYILNGLLWALAHLLEEIEFMHYFFDYLSEIKEDCNTLYYCATRAYENSLARYHNWLVRKTAYFIMNFLPSKSSLLQHIEGTENDIKQQCRQGVPIIKKVHKYISNLYEEYNLHGKV